MKPNCCPYEGPSYKKEGSPLNEGEGPPSESEEMKSSANFGNLIFFEKRDFHFWGISQRERGQWAVHKLVFGDLSEF